MKVAKFNGSLFEQHNHWVTNVEANIAAVVMGYRVAPFFNYEAVPVSFVGSIKFFFDFTCDIREVTWVVVFKSPQRGDYCVLLFVLGHVCALNQHLLICCSAERLQRVLVVTGHYRN